MVFTLGTFAAVWIRVWLFPVLPQCWSATTRVLWNLWCCYRLKHMRGLICFLSKCRPEYELRSHSQELWHSSSANELLPHLTGILGFGTTVHFMVHMTAFTLLIFHVKRVHYNTEHYTGCLINPQSHGFCIFILFCF